MALTRWDRFGIDLPERWRRRLDLDAEQAGWLRVEERHEDGALIIGVEIPGVDPEKDVDVSVADGLLSISAKREERSKDEQKGQYRSEFRYGEFTRRLRLPSGVDKDSVSAQYKDGILEVKIPWPAEPEGRSTKVPVARS